MLNKSLLIPFLFLFLAMQVSFAQENTIVIHTDKGKETIGKHIYGHLSEYLGRCIYGGFFVGKGSDIPSVNGIKADVVEALRGPEFPVLRWSDKHHYS